MSMRTSDARDFSYAPFALSLSKGSVPQAIRWWIAALRQAQGERWLWAALLALAACDVKPVDKATVARAEAARKAIAAAEGRIECAPPGASSFGYVCGIDRRETQDGLFLTLRHPDGGFHRLLVTSDGRGVIAADGAEQAQVTPLGKDLIEVALGGARYRLPATVRQLKTKRS